MTSEHLAGLPSESGAITVKICHRVKPGARAEYETWLKRIIHVAAQYPGHLGVHILRPAEGHNDNEIALRFASHTDAGRWLESSERKAFWARKSYRYAHLRKHSLHATQSSTMCSPDQPVMLFHLSPLEKPHELDA
ncbi:MAG: antibiotic biosynthesis monooxygenase [Pseudomonadota bacterium]